MTAHASSRLTNEIMAASANATSHRPTVEAAWKELVGTYGQQLDTPSMKQQFECHVMGHMLLVATNDLQYDLEYTRPANTYWAMQILPRTASNGPGASCNW